MFLVQMADGWKFILNNINSLRFVFVPWIFHCIMLLAMVLGVGLSFSMSMVSRLSDLFMIHVDFLNRSPLLFLNLSRERVILFQFDLIWILIRSFQSKCSFLVKHMDWFDSGFLFYRHISKLSWISASASYNHSSRSIYVL